ncbi:MAG: alanine racemase [Bacteroidetes bacterium]|nr:alanine racemase [Bacteroidota bacterium]
MIEIPLYGDDIFRPGSSLAVSLSCPTLLLDKKKCISNIRRMKARAEQNRVRFRPHFKTHQSGAIGEWFKEEGIKAITVSSVSMAGYFMSYGWEDITIAFPLNIHEIPVLNLFDPSVEIQVVVSSAETAGILTNRAARPFGVYIEIDTGYHRSGLQANEKAALQAVVNALSTNPLLTVCGFLSHFGNTYQARSKEEIRAIYQEGITRLNELTGYFSGDHPDLEISIGDTPGCSLMDDLEGIDEIRPGNFVLYDLMQQQTGSCSFNDIACAMACPVVEVHSDRNEAVIYGGAVHLSKDFLINPDQTRSYGRVSELAEQGWTEPYEGVYLSSLSQEHGIIHVPSPLMPLFYPGKWVAIIPVHSCLTVSCMREYRTLENERISAMGG